MGNDVLKDRIWQIFQNDNINKKYIENLTFRVDTNYDNDENDIKPIHNNSNSVGNFENENNKYSTGNTHSTSKSNSSKSNKYLTTTTKIINTIPTSAAEDLHNTAPIISSSSSYIPENNTIKNEVPLKNENNVSLTSNIREWMNTTVFTFKGFNISYLYVVIATASAVLIFSLLLLMCVIVRRKHKNKRKRMKLIDISNTSNLRNMLEGTTTNSQDGFDDDNVNNNNRSYENMLMKNKNNNCSDFNDYPNYPDHKLSSPASTQFHTLPIMKNPSATHSTGKSIDIFQSNYNRMSSPVFPSSSSPLNRPFQKNYNFSNNQDSEFVSDYDFYVIENKDPTLKNSTKSLKNKGKSSPVATDQMEFSDETPILSEDNVKNNEINDQNNNNNNNNNENNNNDDKNKNYYYNGYNNNDNKYYNNNIEEDIKNDKDVNNLYPDNKNNNNYHRNLFAERNYNSLPRFNNLPMYGKNSNKIKYMSVISPKEGYQYKMNYPVDYLYQQRSSSSELNTLSPIKNSLPNYMNFNNPPNTLNKMVSPTTRLGSAPPPSSNQYINNGNIVLPPINLLNDENLINESENYPVDLDYLAEYSYKPVVNDELDISINDRIHLLQTYSDGWGFGKNVTTGKLGVFPLNRLFSVKRVKSDKESEKTKVNDNADNAASESPVISNNKISYSSSNIHHKNPSQETLTNGKNSSSNTEQNNATGTITANLNNMNNTNRVKPSKNRTLIIKNLSDEDLHEKNQSSILSNNNNHLDINKNKSNNSDKRDITNDKQYFNNLHDNDIKIKNKDNEKKESEEKDIDSVLRLKIDYDDIKINKSSSNQNNNTKKNLKIY
jgi:hypothetical protein